MVYADLNSQFGLANSVYPVVVDAAAIKQGLIRLLHTPKGHNPFDRNYGSTIYSLLFENRAILMDAARFLYMDITDYEPSISIAPNGVRITRINNNAYEINCYYTIPALNNIPSSLETILNRE